MRVLLDQIRNDAETRFAPPLNTHPAEELARYRKFLKLETHRLKMHHRAGAGGREVCRARALVLDLLLTHLLTALEASAATKGKQTRYALVAIGGYGRGELNPFSDIDIMFLHDGTLTPSHPPAFMELLTGGLLWDLGLKVGHSVRSLADCVKVANTDMQSKTSLIEARLIRGEAPLFSEMQAQVLSKCVTGQEDEYIAARIADQAARRAKFGNSPLMQEPNLKNGCGGLRDFQNLLWMAFFKYRKLTLAELEERELISRHEHRDLEAAYDFLLRTRNELHYHVERAVDVLTKSVQPAVAHNLGYTERSPSRRIELFMGDYYLHARNISLITRTLEQRLALLPQPKQLPTLKQFLRQRRQNAMYAIDEFKFVDGEAHAASPRVFQAQPQRLMRIFRQVQQRNLRLNPDLAQLIRNEARLMDKNLRDQPQTHEVFLEILNQRGNVGSVVRAMHETGLLGRYLPAFGKLTCLVQHEFFHQYTADEHTLVCLEMLDQLGRAHEAPLAAYAALWNKIERPFVLYLALLLHDAGKAGHKREHPEISSRIALSYARRAKLDAPATRALVLLVRHHLEMVLVSQRRDLDDHAVIQAFAAKVETLEHLNLLTILTVVDSYATSSQLWNGFKDSLLWTLHKKTRELLSGGAEFVRAEERKRERLVKEVRAIAPPTFGEDEVVGHFNALPPRYFLLRSSPEILMDLAMAHRFMHRQLTEQENPLEPIIVWHHEEHRGYSQVKVCTWDRSRLFSSIAGALTAAGLNILSAEIFTRTDGIVIDTFLVTNAQTGVLASAEDQERFERTLNEVLAGSLDLHELLRKRKRAVSFSALMQGEQMPTTIRFDNDPEATRTVLDLETEDRVGLLHAISSSLADLGIDISIAKICTEKGAVLDSFYVSEAGGRRIVDRARQRQVELKLRKAIARLE